MAEILTTKLKNDTVRLFYDDIQNNDYYVFVSSVASDPLTRINAENSQYSKNLFLERTLFGKKIFNSDVKFMIKYYPWQKDLTYVQYDDRENLQDKRFYAVVNPTNSDEDYRVYKCLANGNDSPSTIPPNFISGIDVYPLPDGYVWQFMYSLTVPQFEAYNAIGYIPLLGNFEIDPTANSNNVVYGSEVSDIRVENFIDNNGYPSVQVGVTAANGGNDGTIVLRSDELSSITNYYSGMSIYLTRSSGNESFVYQIDTYSYDVSKGLGTVKVIGNPGATGDAILNNTVFKILPRIKITGDGSGAIAIPNMVDERIDSITIVESGSGYNNAVAQVVDPLYNFDPDDPLSIDVRAVLRPVLSPKGGHNYNLIDEMHCRHVLLYGYITETDNNQIGATNTYSLIGIVKNPEFSEDPETANTASPDVFDNRIAIVTDDYQKAVVDTRLIQLDVNNEITFSGKVHQVDETSNTVYLSEYMGPYANVANNDISFNTATVLRNETGQLIQINSPTANNVIESRYTQRSGTVYFMEDFFPLSRSRTSREEYKLVLEF